MLNEFINKITSITDKNDFEDLFIEEKTRDLSLTNRVKMAEEYSKISDPSEKQTVVIAYTHYPERWEHPDRFLTDQEAQTVFSAYNKAASVTNDKNIKNEITKHLGELTLQHPELSDKALKLTEEHLTDSYYAIQTVTRAIRANSKNADQGFALLHQVVEKQTKNADSSTGGYSNPTEQLRIHLNDIVQTNPELITTTLREFNSFKKYMSENQQNTFMEHFRGALENRKDKTKQDENMQQILYEASYFEDHRDKTKITPEFMDKLISASMNK